MKHNYKEIVEEALTKPGELSKAYSAFYHYSVGNQWLAMGQLGRAEPINTYKGWQKLGRNVKKGEKAIMLLMPVVKKDIDENGKEKTQMFFIAKKNWFSLSQTDGEEYKAEAIPNFNTDLCLETLGIKKTAFNSMDGNTMGYAIPSDKKISVNPIAFDPFKTTIHEVAHCLLHETALNDHQVLTSDVKEVEAELTAYLVKSCLGILSGLEYSRGYIQNWIQNDTNEKVRFSKVFGAVDKILKAGRNNQKEEAV